MPFVTRLSHGDYDGAISVVAEAAAGDGQQPFELATVRALLRLIPADRGGYYEMRIGKGGNRYFVDDPTVPEIDWSQLDLATIWSWPLWEAHVGGSVEPLKLSDFLSESKLNANAWYTTVQRPRDVKHELKLWLPARNGTLPGFFLLRGPGRRDFDERDRAVLALLRPHLTAIRERWERRHRPSPLTEREAEVLELVANGLTNRQIAHHLNVAPPTVRAHLEHIYAKLGVHTRTAAAIWLRGTRG